MPSLPLARASLPVGERTKIADVLGIRAGDPFAQRLVRVTRAIERVGDSKSLLETPKSQEIKL